MTDLRTIRIPVSVDSAITYLDETVDVGKPIHVVGTSENPDDFCIAFYAEPGGNTDDHNHRASLIAHAAARRDEEVPLIVGDALLAMEPALADKIIEHDAEQRQDLVVVKAFRAWLLDYSTANNLDAADVFTSCAAYVAHVAHETMEAARHDHAQHIASLLGLDTNQVGVFFV